MQICAFCKQNEIFYKSTYVSLQFALWSSKSLIPKNMPTYHKKTWINLLSSVNTRNCIDLLFSASFSCALWLAAWYQTISAPSSVVIRLFLRKYSSTFSLQDPKTTFKSKWMDCFSWGKHFLIILGRAYFWGE